MRLILMGTGGFAVPSFNALANRPEIEIVTVVTRPIVNQNAKQKAGDTPVRDWATAHGFDIVDPDSINSVESIQWLESMHVDLFVVCDYGQILSSDALATSKLGGINLHGSLLPRHRGAAPVQWAILRGDLQTGVSVIHMTPKLDGGPIISEATVAIEPFENADHLEKRLSEIGVACTLDAVDQLAMKNTTNDDLKTVEHTCVKLGRLQDSSQVTTAPRLKKLFAEFDCRYPVAILSRQFRGLQPWPGTFAMMQLDANKQSRVIFGDTWPIESNTDDFELGQIVWSDRSISHQQLIEAFTIKNPSIGVKSSDPMMLITCKDGFIAVSKLQLAGKRMMSAGEIRAGYDRQSSGLVSGMRIVASSGDEKHHLLEKLVAIK